MKRLLAVASSGGHWVQLRRLREAFDGHAVTWVSTNAELGAELEGAPFHVIRDGSRSNPVALLHSTWQLLWIMLSTRPDVVLSTGAAPGLAALLLGRLFRCRTVWIDSAANVECMSSSGLRARRFADLWLTQWEHLARPEGPRFLGNVL